jgi:flagellar protein FlaF
MGFSVSGAAAIIFVSMFIAFGMWFTAASNGFDRITDAQDTQTESTLEASNTAIQIDSAQYDPSTDVLTITASNTGTTELSLAATDLLEDGAFVSGWESSATVEGNGATDLWLPGETLSIELTRTTGPTRVKLVTPSSVADSTTVTQL